MINEEVRHEISDFIKLKTGCRQHIQVLFDEDESVNISHTMEPEKAIFLLKKVILTIESRMEETITYKVI